MLELRVKTKTMRYLFGVFSITFVLSVMVACESPRSPNNQANSAVGAAATSTQVQDPLAATKQALDNLYETRLDQMRTVAVLSHVPTNISGPPPTDTPGPPPPSPTLEMGIIHNVYAHPDGMNSWRGIVDGQVVQVDATGNQIYAGDSKAGSMPTGQFTGVLRVYTASGENDYITTIQPGPVIFISANGVRLTIGQEDPQNRFHAIANGPTAVFDIATRQFISASGTPIPTTPIPLPL